MTAAAGVTPTGLTAALLRLAAGLTRLATAEPVDKALLSLQNGVIVEPVGFAPLTQTGQTKLKKKQTYMGASGEPWCCLV